MFIGAKILFCLFVGQLSWADSFAAIEAESRKVQSIEAEFTQTKELKMLSKPISSTGRMYYRRPAEFRWEYAAPIRSVLVKNKQGVKRVTWRGGKFEPEADAKLMPVQRVLEQLEQWLRGDFSRSTVFEAKLIPGTPTRVELRPREKSLAQYIQAVQIILSSTPGAVDGIEIWEGPDSVTRIKLKNVKLNQPLPPHVFELPK